MKGWRGPRFPGEFPSLGYEVLAWTARYLPSPMDQAKPLRFTDQQATTIIRWYALDPITGRFVYRRAALEEAKGYGKSPFAAALALVEFAGPCVFDGWDASGEPVAKPWGGGDTPDPWVQIAAVSEDQTDNTYAALYEMLVANDHRAAKDLHIDSGRTRLFLTDRPGRLEPVTASAGSREGQRLTFAVLDETHLWTPRNGGRKLANTLRRNTAKMSGRTFETTNAPTLGEKSVAEQTGDDAEDGTSGILHIAHRPPSEPQPEWTDEQLLEALGQTYADAPWAPRERILQECRDPATDWSDVLRFYFNIRTTGAGRAVDPRVWDSLARPQEVPAGTRIGVGFDGSISRDATVLRGCTEAGYRFLIRKWERPRDAPPDWKVDRADVAQAVAEAFVRYDVGRMYCDPPKWWTEIEDWQRQYGEGSDGKPRVLPLDTNQARRFAPAVDRWLTGIREGHTHDGDPFTTENVKSAHLKVVRIADGDEDGRTAHVLIRGDEGRRIDAAVADVLAYEAAMSMPEAVVAPVVTFIDFEDPDLYPDDEPDDWEDA